MLQCSHSCGKGVRVRSVKCFSPSGAVLIDTSCTRHHRPKNRQVGQVVSAAVGVFSGSAENSLLYKTIQYFNFNILTLKLLYCECDLIKR